MSIEDNKNLSKKLFEEVWNKGNLDVVDDLIALDYVIHMGNKDLVGIDNYKNFVKIYRNAFPDIYYTVNDLIAEDDKVVERWSAQGTHKGELLGIPPTNKKLKVTGIDIVRIKEGKMVERWAEYDFQGMMEQLGVIKSLNMQNP